MYSKKLKTKMLTIIISSVTAVTMEFTTSYFPVLISESPVFAEDSMEDAVLDGDMDDNTETNVSTLNVGIGGTDTNEIGSSGEAILTGASESTPLANYAASAIKMENSGQFYSAENTITATFQSITDDDLFKTEEITRSGVLYSLKVPAHTRVAIMDNNSCRARIIYIDLQSHPVYTDAFNLGSSSNDLWSDHKGWIVNTSSSTQTYYIWVIEPTLPYSLTYYDPLPIPDTALSLDESLIQVPSLTLGNNNFSSQNIIASYFYLKINGDDDQRFAENILYHINYKFTVPVGKAYKLSGKGDGVIPEWKSDIGYTSVGYIFSNNDEEFNNNYDLRMFSDGSIKTFNDNDDVDENYIFQNSSTKEKTYYIDFYFPDTYETEDLPSDIIKKLHVSTLTLEDVTYSSVTSEVKPIGTAPAASMNITTEALADAVLTDEEKKLQVEGADVDIYLEIADITSTISAENKSKVENAITSNDTVGMYTDINLYKKIGDCDAVKITKVDGNKLSISIALPDSLKTTDASINRTYKIVRLHDSAADILDTKYDAAAGTLTFETDAFSVYAIVYSDTVNTASISDTTQASTEVATTASTTAATSPKTGDSVPILCLYIILSLTLMIGICIKLSYRTK